MKGQDLLKGMGYIDDGLIEDALNEARPRVLFLRRPAVRRWTVAAACLAIAAFAGWGATQGVRDNAAPAQAPLLGEQKDASYVVSSTESDAAETADNGWEYAGAFEEAPQQMEDSDAEPDAVAERIESYPGNYSNVCYEVPAAGESGLSLPLQDAMAEYHEAVTYRVYAEIFADGAQTPLPGDDPEVAALLQMLRRDYGIEASLESAADAQGARRVYPSLEMTFDQLRRFPGDEAHGWMLYLYGERIE